MIDISAAFATSPATPDHIARAEQLGYRRAADISGGGGS
jgi:hypothetical protein